MKAVTYNFDYSKKKVFKFALFSDLHADAKYCQKNKLIKNLKWAYDNTDGILLNGDIYSCLMPKDLKRFTLSHAIAERDDYKDFIIDYVFDDILKPFADKIMLIAMGNHESTVLKYLGTNPLNDLRRQIKSAGGNAILGDYQNLIRFKFAHGDNSKIRNYEIWTCHGMGAGAKRSRGSLEWDIVYSRYDARLYWMGHNHMAEVDHTGSYTYLDREGQIKSHSKKGIRTPSWEELVSIRDIESPYDIKYGEEKHGIPCAPAQFGLLSIDLGNHDCMPKDSIMLMDV